MKTINYLALLFMIWGSAVFIKFAHIKPYFEEHPFSALVIFMVAALVYRITDKDF